MCLLSIDKLNVKHMPQRRFFRKDHTGYKKDLSYSKKCDMYEMSEKCHIKIFFLLTVTIQVSVLTYWSFTSLFLAPAVTVGETKGAMDSTSVFFGLFFCL